MKARRMDAVWRGLDAGERAQLTLTAARDGLNPDAAVERLMPRHQRGQYAALMRVGLTVLTRLRASVLRLETSVEVLEGQVELLALRQAWALDRAELLRYVPAPEADDPEAVLLREHLEASGPSVSDLSATRTSPFEDFLESEVTVEDVRAKLTVLSALSRFRHAWPTLVALEQAVPVVDQYFADRGFADSLLAADLEACRRRIRAAHASLEAMLGPVEFPDPQPEAVAAVRDVLRRAAQRTA